MSLKVTEIQDLPPPCNATYLMSLKNIEHAHLSVVKMIFELADGIGTRM